jgi:hypothetical protein
MKALTLYPGAFPMKTRAIVLFVACAVSASSCANDDGSSAANIVGVPGGGHFGARGLIGANESRATFDTTTGAFDSSDPPAPGDIADLDLTVFNTDGSVNFTRSFDSINAAAYSFALDGLAHGTPYRIHARVRGDGGPFADVTLDGSVRFRPDIAVGPSHMLQGIIGPDRSHGNVPSNGHAFGNDGIIGPDRVLVGRTITISTLVEEKNGETGATTDCVLGIIGPDHTALPSQTVPVSLAAGGTTYCSFTTSFETVGAYSVTIRAANITPNDTVLSNNQISFDLSIIGPDHTR